MAELEDIGGQYGQGLRDYLSQIGTNYAQGGQYAPNIGPFCSNSAVALTASRLYLVRFVAHKTQNISKIAFFVTTAAGANDNCDVGIFNSAGTTLLASAGSTAGKLNQSPGPQTVTFTAPTAIRAGTVYYAAFACGTFGGTAAQLAMTNLASGANLGILFGSTVGLIEQTFQASAFPITAPATTAGAVTSAPIMSLQN